MKEGDGEEVGGGGEGDNDDSASEAPWIPSSKKQQKKKPTTTPKVIPQAPPVAWRFYHCYERDELASDAAAGAAGATAMLASSSEVEARTPAPPLVIALKPVADRGNWCVELWRRE